MLLKQQILKGILVGRIDLAFRRWKRPTVKAGGSLRTIIGVLAIEAVYVVDELGISNRDAKRARYESRQELLADAYVTNSASLLRTVVSHEFRRSGGGRYAINRRGTVTDSA